MKTNIDMQWILLDRTLDIGRFGHFFHSTNSCLSQCWTIKS